ncbi:hypothetical protein N9R01_02410 [Porticoccaceae bacterium]|nr:hypothetical protein [Porticoccaceae bacterium]
MAQSNNRNAIRQRSAWIASMVACGAFLLMAVKVYDVPLSDMGSNLLAMVLGLAVIIGAAALLGRLIATLRQRFK